MGKKLDQKVYEECVDVWHATLENLYEKYDVQNLSKDDLGDFYTGVCGALCANFLMFLKDSVKQDEFLKSVNSYCDVMKELADITLRVEKCSD